MMRSGLQKPGAIPLFALLFFSLFSLVPSLAKEWDFSNLHLGYIGYRSEVRQVSRVKDSCTDVRSRFRVTGVQWKPWLLDGYYQSYYDRKARPRRCAVDAPSRSAFEAAAVFDTDPLAFPVRESSAFTRGVRAFKALVVRQPDSGLLPSFPAEGDSVEKLPTRLASLINSSVIPIPLDDEPPRIRNDSGTIPATSGVVEVSRWLLNVSRESWQQVCRAGSEYLENATAWHGLLGSAQPLSGLSRLDSNSSCGPAVPQEPMVVPKAMVNVSEDINASHSAPMRPIATSAPSPNSTAMAAGLQQESEHVRRGSCMAIVIGLVVGVMWF
ncbi:hypothetical protein BO94DRAFT_244008 [Aspergillus sclerotioniger CBS 115572]|uniref:Transmembrane protein n=1 Tax=Aspergillus sclerotioniger CBS 115572 TaxID=1450535 RepID=A0A317VGZ2_9EURO|nr:hypothetical protein BO94DRAFT_244008 [Aspergillus sclerotioniger CBS 115572]PWY73225.1 hypothetical protein BO94DRAFT_244008 [Aspergillus sclerotioniger CBS 115572]